MTLKSVVRRGLSVLTPAPDDTHLRLLRGAEAENTRFKKYVIFGHQRCGSSVLTSGLKSHPRVKAFAELFTSNHITFNYPGYNNQSIPMLALRDRNNRKFLEDVVFCPQPKEIEAVGFKVFPEQIDKKRFNDVWRWIVEDKDVATIILNRNNSLATLCSVTIAKKTGIWGIKDAQKRPTLTLKLDPIKCQQFFELRESYNQLVRDRLKHTNVMEISYETFSQDIPKHFKIVQDFIGITPIELPVNDLKKETRSLAEVIENYADLKAYFASSRWRSFFSD